MDALAKFVSEAIYSPVTCLGVSLRPFSRGHYWLLAKIRSPFLYGGKAAVKDLMMGVLICSQDFHGALAALVDSELEDDLKAWERRIRGRGITRLLPKIAARRLSKAYLIFKAYLNAGAREPYIQAQVAKQDASISSDWSMLSVVASMRTFRMSFEDAANMYAPMARWLLAIQGERDGTVEIVDRDERAALQREADEIAREVFSDKKENAK